MKDSIKVYSLPTCGMCKLLKSKLSFAHIPFEVCEDISEMEKLNINHVPVLSVNGTLYSFKDALQLINGGKLC